MAVVADDRRIRHRAKGRTHLVGAPAGIAGIAPIVEVAPVAAHPDHGVDRGGAAQHPAARPVIDISGQPRIGFGAVHPVDLRIEEGLAVAQRHLHEKAPVVTTSLKHQDLVAAGRRQALGHDATGRTGADDDEVRIVHGVLLGCSGRRPVDAQPLSHLAQPSNGFATPTAV
jgi:hypothetical protein